jgi:two-component system chemotaxis sensor kinase CheA
MTTQLGLGDDDMKEILEDFFSEADENLDAVEQDLIRLEAASEGGVDGETVDRLFRALHTLKGSAGFLGFDKITEVAHAGETLLDAVREQEVDVDKPVVDALLQATDVLKALLHLKKIREADDAVDVVTICGELEALAGGIEEEDAEDEAEEDAAEEEVMEEPENEDEEIEEAPAIDGAVLQEVMADPRLSDGPVTAKPAKEVIRAPEERRKKDRRADEESVDTVRVKAERLDALVNLAGELTLSRNMLMQQLQAPEVAKALAALAQGAAVEEAAERVNRVTQALQQGILSTRMQPLAKVFERIPRVVRDLKERLGKQVNLIVEGDGVEADKVLVEALADPILHLVRNALDHGIEAGHVRKKAGKHAEGTVAVRAFHESNTVVVEVQDDGAGIDAEAVRQTAVERGIVSEEAALAMGEAEAMWLVTRPGFSTNADADEVSGRGVGLDVVLAQVEKLHGRMEIVSEVGVGTCFRLKLPLTLAIVNALIVGDREEGYAIPLRDIAEVVKVRPGAIGHVNGKAVMDLRGEVIALSELGALGEAVTTIPTSGYVVVVRESNQAVGLIVERLVGQEEMVVKSLNRVVSANKAIAGATVASDGGVHMILDIPYLLKSAGGTPGQALPQA